MISIRPNIQKNLLHKIFFNIFFSFCLFSISITSNKGILDYTNPQEFLRDFPGKSLIMPQFLSKALGRQFSTTEGNLSSFLFSKWKFPLLNFDAASPMNMLAFTKKTFSFLGIDPYEMVISHGKGTFDIYNILFYYFVIIPRYLKFLDEVSQHLTSIFNGNHTLLDAINAARKKKVDNESGYLKIRNVIFNNNITGPLFYFVLGLNLVFNGLVIGFNYFLSTLIQIKINNNPSDPFLNFQLNDDPENLNGIRSNDLFNIFVAPFSNQTNFKSLEDTLKNKLMDTIFTNVDANHFFLNFFLINGIVWMKNALLQKLFNFMTKSFQSPPDYTNIHEPGKSLSPNSDDEVNFNVSKSLFTPINYLHHFQAPLYMIKMLKEYVTHAKLLEFQLQAILAKTEEQFKETPINFDQKNFPIGSLRSFFLDDQPNKKKVFQLIKKWKKLLKKNSINFKNFPSESLIILGDIGSGKTTMMNIMINYVNQMMEDQKIKINKAIFSGRVPVLRNLLKKDELKEVILKALQKAFKSEVNLMIIEDIDQVLPNRSNNINIASYMSINTYLINVNVGEGNAEKGFAGIILGTAQKAKNLDSAVIRRSSFVIVNIKNKKRLKKMLIVKYLLTELQNSDENYQKFFILSNFKSDVKHILNIARFQETYKIFYLLSKSLIYLKFFIESLEDMAETIESNKKAVDQLYVQKMINEENFEVNELYKNINIALLNYCHRNVVFNKDTMTNIITKASII